MFTAPRFRLALSILALGTFALNAGAQSTIQVDAGRGPLTVHIPSSYNSEEPLPLVMLLHGYGSSGAQQESYLQLAPLTEAYGFLYVYPDGTQNNQGQRFWNATGACCDFFNSNVDDAGYLRGLIDLIKGTLTVDANRVFVAGHSNGGFMAYKMACEHADAIAAVASLAGAAHNNVNACSPSQPVDVLQIHGTADGTINYNGGNTGAANYPSAIGTAERWATYDGCSLLQDNTVPNLDLVGNLAGAETTVTRWTDACNSGGSAELWTIQGGTHVPNFNGNFRVAVIEYLLAHPKPGLGARYCQPNNNSTGQPAVIHGAGSVSVNSNDLVLSSTSVPASANGLFFYGPVTASAPLGNGVLCIAAGGVGLFRLPVVNSGVQGVLQSSVDLTSPPNPAGTIQPGDTWKFQAWFRDPGAGAGMFNLSDALSLTFTP